MLSMAIERESIEFDILIVGGGPAGLATAIWEVTCWCEMAVFAAR